MDVGLLLAALSSMFTATASISETKFVKRFSRTNPPLFQDKSFAFSCVGRCASLSTCRGTNVVFAEKKCHYYTLEEVESMTAFKDVLYQKVSSNVEQTTEMIPPVPQCQNGGKWSDLTNTSCDCTGSFTGTYCERYWDDCSEGYRMNILTDGVYTIQPRPYGTPFQVYCNMIFGGRTSVQKQSSGINFNRNWQDYTDGFGTPGGDHWLGLEKMKAISDKTPSKFIVRLAYNNAPAWRQIICQYFSLSDAVSGFRINFTGTTNPQKDQNRLQDVMTDLRGARFSTYDRDNDEKRAGSCAQTHKSGWWFRDCTRCNPNGILKPIPYIATDLDDIFCKGDTRGVKETTMYLGGY